MTLPPASARRRRFVLLDRDGTIIEDRHYLSDPAQVALLPNAAEGLRRMRALGLGLVVVSNQSGIGRGLFTGAQAEEVNRAMTDRLGVDGVELDGIYMCPHAPEAGCDCRKPATGLAHQAAHALGFAPERCFVVGDKVVDMAMSRRLGSTGILVRTGYGSDPASAGEADYVVDDLLGAARIIEALLGARDCEHA